LDAFLSALQASALCDEQQFQQLNGDALVHLYDNTVTALLNEQVPVRRVCYRVRASSLWFHDECRTAKRALRLSERKLLVTLVFSRTPALLPLPPTAPSATGMSPFCVRKSPRSGPSASMLENRSHVSSGGRLINCLAKAKLLCHLTLMHLPSISSSTTRLPVFGQLLRALMNLGRV